MRMLDAAATAAALPYARLVPAVAQAALDLRDGRIQAATRTGLPLPAGGRFLAMPATDDRFAICKLVSVTPANRDRGRPLLHAVVAVGDAVTGEYLALLDGATVTARRTAALSVLGIETLRLGAIPRCVVLVGTGVQAAAHANAMAERWPGVELRCVGRTAAAAEAFSAARAKEGVKAAPFAIGLALRDADVVVTATSSTTAVLPSPIDDHTLVVGIGSFTPEMAELPAAEVRRRTIVVDDVAGAKHEAGDLLQAGVDWTRVHPLADLLDGRITPHGAMLFKTVGHAAWDMAAARTALGGERSG